MHNNKFVYISIPKSGGTYTRRSFVDKNGNAYCWGHSKCMTKEFMHSKLSNEYYKSRDWFFPDTRTVIDDFDNCIKFSVIRNPFDLLTSYFVSRWGDFDSGMKIKLPRLGFDGLVEEFCNNSEWHVPFFRDFLYFQLFDENGDSRCDYAIIYDNLENGLVEFSNKFDLYYKTSDRMNITSNKKNYKDYYNNNLIEMVYNKCQIELEMFNFDFDGYKGTDNIIDMSNFKVDWDKIIK